MRDPMIAEAAEKARALYDGKQGFANDGRLNLYQCESNPGHMLITVDREPGVTPFTIECPMCKEAGARAIRGFYRSPAMQSSAYRVSQSLRPTHEWYRPDSLDGMSAGAANHVLKGGLMLRPITGQPA